jgi:hypothetical protein
MDQTVPNPKARIRRLQCLNCPRTLEVKDYRNKPARRRRLSNPSLRSINKWFRQLPGYRNLLLHLQNPEAAVC